MMTPFDQFADGAMRMLMAEQPGTTHQMREAADQIAAVIHTCTDRDAARALGPIEDSLRVGLNRGQIAAYAFDMADAMMAERTRRIR